jgi:hypothetical protein
MLIKKHFQRIRDREPNERPNNESPTQAVAYLVAVAGA